MKRTRSSTPKKHSNILRSLPKNHLHQCICLCLGISNFSYAGPEGGEVVGGAGSINRSGSTTTINQATDRMAIDWQSYDVGSSERVHYIQPDSSSVSLNRILSNTGSRIQGRIDANGHVILMNPHGILFGKDSVVNAGGILASGLNIDAADFMNGDFTFGAIEDTEGLVINAGTLNAAIGGSVSLIGKEVKNDGLISAQLGSVTFAAGREAVVSFDDRGMVSVRITQALLEDDIGVDAAVINNGEIQSEDGQILLTASTSRDVFSQAVNSGELNTAVSVVMDDDGSFTLGGGADVVNTGVLSASGDAGGAVVLLGENVTHSGEIHADSYQSDVAGMIEIHSADTTLFTENSVISASADEGAGGDIKLLGERVGLVEQASVVADGATAGGQVLVGGDYRGENSGIRNASAVYVGVDTHISASATENGDGGKIILWGNDRLTALGQINAIGVEYGDGGFVETSSAVVNLAPNVNVSSELGGSGTWLIDPYNITIQSSGTTNLVPGDEELFDLVFLPNSDDSILTTGSLELSLAGDNNVLIETTGAGGQDGDIILADQLNYDSRGNASLTLRAHDDIQINASIGDGRPTFGTDSLNLTLTANYQNGGALLGGGNITIADGVSINTQGGTFTATGYDFTLGSINSIDAGGLDTGGGNVDLFLSGDVSIGNLIDTGGGTFTVGDASGGIYGSSFDNYLSGNGGGITTEGGAITITTIVDASANGDVTLGTIDNGTDADVMSGNVTVTSGNNIILQSDYDFHDTATGPIDSDTTDPTFTTLTLTADNAITIYGQIYDSSAPSWSTALRNQDTLNVTLNANQQSGNTTGHLTLNNDIYTAGGTVTISGANLDGSDQIIHTGYASATEAGYSTTGGHITLDMSGTATLGAITTENGDAFGNLNVAATSISDNGVQGVRVAGSSTFTAEGGVLAITLDNSDHIFLGDIAIASDQTTLTLGDININTGGTAVSVNATGAITQASGTDAITLNGSSLTIDGTSVLTQDIDTSGAADQSGGAVLITASTGNITVGDITTDSGQRSDSTNAVDGNSYGFYGDGIRGYTAGSVTLTASSLASEVLVGEVSAVGGDGNDSVDGSCSTSNDGINCFTGSPGGMGGAITITADQFVRFTALATNGGNASAEGGGQNDVAPGGDAGLITVEANSIYVGGNLSARGGVLADGNNTDSNASAYNGQSAGITLTGDIILSGDSQIDTTLLATPAYESIVLGDVILDGSVNEDTTVTGQESLTIQAANVDIIGQVGTSDNPIGVLQITSITSAADGVDIADRDVDAGPDIDTYFDVFATSVNVTASNINSGAVSTAGLADTAGGRIVIAVDASLTTGDLDTSGGTPTTGDGFLGGGIDLDAADIIIGAIDASGSNADRDTGGTGGNGGVVTVTATENSGSPGIQVNGDIDVNAGTGDTDGTTTAASLVLAGSGTTSAGVLLNTSSFITSSISITGTGQSTDTLTGLSDSSYWVSLASGDGSILDAVSGSETVTIGFTGFEMLQGGDADDHFSVGHNFTSIRGGDGIDEFTTTANTTGRLFGEGGVDTFHVNHNVNDSVNNNGDVVGGAGDDIFNVVSGITVELDGDTGTADTLNLVDTSGTHTWVLATASSGTLNPNIEFASMEQLNGATGALGDTDPSGGDDQFTFNFPGTYGSDDGGINARGGDNDSVLVTNSSNPIEVTLGDNLFGVVSAETIASNGANNGAGFTLQLNSDATTAGSATTWTIDGINDGTIDNGVDAAINFTNFASLQGNQANDSFEVETGGSIVSVSGIRGDGSLQTNESNTLSIVGGPNTWTLSGRHAGNVTVTHTTAFSEIQSLSGSGGDTLTARDQENDWTIGATNSVAATTAQDPSDALAFSGMNILNGRSYYDHFTFNSDFIGTVNGGGNHDEFFINQTVQAALNGDAGNDTFTFGDSGLATGIISGGADGNDTIAGSNVAETWVVSGDHSGSVVGYAASFNGIETLDGRGGNDIFNVNAPGSIFSRIVGGAGTDRVDFRASNTAFAVLIDEDNAQTSSDFRVSGVEWVAGAASQTNTLTVVSDPADDYRWELEDYNNDGANFVVVDGVDDGQVHRLDTDGSTILSTVNYTEFDDLTGGAGDDTFVIGINDIDVDIDGGGTGSTADTLVGFDTENTWTITNTNTGALTFGATGNVDFQDIENLTGSDAAADEFTFQQSGAQVGSITGAIEAGGGAFTDIANFSGVDSFQQLVIGGSAGGVNGAEQIVGNENYVATNTLTGNSSFNVWTISDFNGDQGVDDTVDGDNDGRVTDSVGTATIEFVNFGFLQGSSADDTFIMGDAGTIVDIRGAGGSNVIQGRDSASTWTINGGNSGAVGETGTGGETYVAEFQGIDTLTGADDVTDIFNVTTDGSFTGVIQGGANGSDDLRVATSSDSDNRENRWEFTTTTSQVVRVANDNSRSGALTFTGVERLTGGTGNDVFEFGEGVAMASTVIQANNGAGIDTLDLSNLTASSGAYVATFNGSAVVVTRDATEIYRVSGTEHVMGNDESNVRLTSGTSGTNAWDIEASAHTLTNTSYGAVTFADVAYLVGNANADVFEIASDASFTGTLDGVGASNNSLEWLDGGNTWQLTTEHDGTVANTTFTNIQTLTGNNDTLVGRVQNNHWEIDGGNTGTVHLTGDDSDDNDQVRFNGMANVHGNTGDDRFDINAGGSITGLIRGTRVGGQDTAFDRIDMASTTVDVVTWNIDSTGDVAGNDFTQIDIFNGGNGQDLFVIENDALTVSVDGLGNTALAGDTLSLADTYTAQADWTLNGTTDRVVATGGGTVNFDGIEIAQGANNARDTFAIQTASVNSVSGRDGNDQFTLDSSVNTNINLVVVGGDGDDELVGANQNNDWVFGGAVTEEVDTLNYQSAINRGVVFSEVEDFTGGTGNDSFELRSGTIAGDIDGGSTGTDTLTVASTSGTIDWSIDGANTGDVDGVGDGFSRITHLEGGGGSDVFSFDGLSASITEVDGGAGSNSLTVDRASGTTQWRVDGVDTGSVTGVVNRFVATENLSGGDATDVVTFETNTSFVSGLIDGAGGANDQLNLAALTSGVVVEVGDTVTAANPDVTNTLPNIHITGFEQVTAVADADEAADPDTEASNWLVNNQVGNYDWTVDGRNEGELTLNGSVATGLSFENFGRLQGNEGNDRFLFEDGGTITSTFIGGGGAGSDEANFVSVNGTINIVLNDADPVINFSGIETLVGNHDGSEGETNNARLTVATGTNAWTVDDINEGDVDTENTDINFSGFNQLQGGSGQDTFDIDGDGFVSGWIAGGTGTPTDHIDAGNANNTITAQEILLTTDTTTFGRLNIHDIERIQVSGLNHTLYAALTGSNEWDVTSTNNGSLNATLAFEGFDTLLGNGATDNFVVRDGASIADINGAGGGNTLTVESADNALGEVLWSITAANTGQVTGRVTDFSNIDNLTGGEGADRFTFTQTTASIQGLIDGGEALLETDPSTDVLDVSIFVGGVVVELGPNAAPGSLVEDTAGLANVNAHNMEEIVAAEGTPETEENNNWLAIASPSNVDDAPVLDWDWELDNATSELNEGQLQEIDNLIDLTPIENTQTLVFNFGSVQGGTGGENSNVIARNGNDDPDIYFNITGEYRPGSGDRALPYGDVDGLVVVDIDPRIIRLVGNANGEEGNNTLLRVASFDESNDLFDYNGVNNWTIDSENSGTFDNVDNDFSFEFTGVNQLQGGAGNDTFIFATNVDNATTGALVDGTINGGEGTNEIHVTTATGDLNFGVSTLQETSVDPDDIAVFFPELIDPVFLVNNRGGVIDLVGISRLLVTADNTTTLSSANTGDFRWTIGSLGSNSTLVNTGNSDSLTFSGVDRVVGGDANDTFNVMQLGIVDPVFDGGEGGDIVNLDAVSVDADGDDQALMLSLRTPPTENFDAIYLANIETLQALDRGHVLLADDVVNTWLIDNVNGGEIRFDNGDDQRLAFTNIAHLVGGGSQDIFNISEGGRLTGTIDGGDEIANPDRIDVLSDATGAFTFQVSSRDADGSVVDTSANAIDILGVEQLNANNTSEAIQHTLAAANGTNNTFAVGVTSFLFDGSVMLAFTGMDNLTGGDRGDQFIFNGAVVNGLVDGGENLFDSEDSVQILNLTDGISVRLGDQRTDDLNVHNVETITATEPNTHRLIGDNNTNQWQVRGTNAGNVDGVSFSGFASLVGGSADDTFILARQDGADIDDSVSAIDGGANPVTGSATDKIDLTGLIDSTTVAFDPNYDADLIVSNVERIEAIRNNHTLVGGDDVTQEWRITDVDAGEINNTEFTGFSHLLGRSQVDEFVFSESGNITGTVDGGSQPEGQSDVVDMRELEVSNVTIGDLESGFFDIEEYRGNNNNAVIRADDVRNEWEISDANGGTILDINGNNITFSGFTDLEGGTDVDIFSLAGGSISGEISAGEGNDRLEIDLGSGISGDVTFTGNDGDDRITIDGGDNETRFASNYSASVVDSVPHGTLEYSISTANVANNYHVNFTDVETVNDRVFTNTMTVNNVIGRDDIVTIANNRFGLDGFIDIDITNKNSLDIVGEQTDQVIIEGRVSLNDAFSVINASVSGLDANAIIDANRMISFNTTGAIGAVDNRLSIETNNVSFNAVNGDVYVNQTGDLIIAQLSNPAAVIDIDATGNITDGADLSSANAIRLESDGTITLDNNNSLLGVVTLLAANGDVEFTNGTTRLGDVSAQNLSLTTTGNIDDEGLIQVANATTVNGSATSVINLNGENNTFNNVTVTNAGSFFLNDSSANGLTVQGNASDNFIVKASNRVTANAVNANAIEISSADAGITIQNTVNAQNSVEISGEGVDINGSVTVTSSVDSTADRAVLVDARTGDLNIRSAISADAGVLGDIELIGQTVQQFAGAVISGRNVFVDSDTDVNLAANITATEILDVNAGTEIVMDNGLTSTLTQAGTLTFTAVDNIVTQQIVADSVSLISTTGSIDQQGDITAGEISITANAGEFENQAGTVLSVNTGDLVMLAQGANIRGDIQANENAVTFDIDQSFLLSADISAANVNVETGAQITMTSGSKVDSSADITFIAGSDIELSQLNAEDGTASLTAGGSVTDNNGDASNISATSLFARSETGFGATADNANINTSVANIDVQNASGVIGIRNDQEVSITSLITNGNIRFVNTGGNVILSNMVEEDYDRDFNVTDAREAGGVINGNYSFGNVSILVSNGYLAAEPGANSNRPELVGDVIDVTTSNGFGFDRQLVVYAQTELIVSGPGIRPIWAFGEPPLFGLTTDSDLIDPSIVGGLSELLVEVEEAADIDPAIFTNVNNYLYDNISIRMPRDQIYDDDEYYEEDGDEDKEHDEGYYY